MVSNGDAGVKQRGPWLELLAHTTLCRDVWSEYMLLTASDSGVLKYRARLRSTPVFLGGERTGLSEFKLIYLNGDRSRRPIAIHFPCFEIGVGLPDGGTTIEVVYYREGFRDEVMRQLGWRLADDSCRLAA